MTLAEKLRESMKKHVAKHKSTDGAKVVNKTGDVSHFEVHPAENGHVLETHFKPKEGKLGEYMGREEPRKSVHKNMSGVHKEMKENCPCGACAGGEADSGKVVGKADSGEKDDEM